MKKLIILLAISLLLPLQAYSAEKDNLTCLEIKTVMSSNFDSANVIEYFYIDSKNHKVYTENLTPVTEVTCFDDKWIKFTNIYPNKDDKTYNFIRVYEINRYTGHVSKTNYTKAASVGAKICDVLTYGDTQRCTANGTGTAKIIDKPKQQF